MKLFDRLTVGMIWGGFLALGFSSLLLFANLLQRATGMGASEDLFEIAGRTLAIGLIVGLVLWTSSRRATAAAEPRRRWKNAKTPPILALFLLLALGGCDPQVERIPAAEESEAWEAAEWRERLRMHAQGVEPLLPILWEVAEAEDPTTYQGTLQTTYEALQRAEQTIPRIPWSAALPEARLYSRYRSAMRELRYGAERILAVPDPNDATAHHDGRYFLGLGLRHFHEAREHMAGSTAAAADTGWVVVEPIPPQ